MAIFSRRLRALFVGAVSGLVCSSSLHGQYGPPATPPRSSIYSAPVHPPSLGNLPAPNTGYPGTYYDEEAMAALAAAQQNAYAVPTVPLPVVPPVVDDRLSQIEQRLDAAEADKLKLPSIKISGAFQADGVLFNQTGASRDQFGSIENGADFRRARLGAGGSVTPTMNYFMQMDFAAFGHPTFTDVWVEQTQVPLLGNVRVGQWKQPFSLEVVSSYRYTTFMERSSLFQTFTPFRHIGIGFYDHAEDLNTTWAASYFRTGQDQFGGSLSTDGGNGLAGRITQLLWYEEPRGQDYLHVGGSYYMNSPARDAVRFRSIPEIFAGEFAPGAVGTSGQAVPGGLNGTPFFVDTGTLTSVSNVNTFGLESLWVRGPLSIQSETMAAAVNQAGPNATLTGTYAQVGYFLTGEHRPYDRKAGAIDRVTPFNSVGQCGIGAWEVAARWSHVDLNDGLAQGGRMRNLTGGVNWYLNPYCKWVFNYVHSWTEGRDYFPTVTGTTISSQTDAFATRVQLDF